MDIAFRFSSHMKKKEKNNTELTDRELKALIERREEQNNTFKKILYQMEVGKNKANKG